MENQKTCRRCHKIKDLSSFGNFYRAKDGKKTHCKECEKEYNRARYEFKKDTIKTQVRAWQEKNAAKMKEYAQKFSEKMRRRADDTKTSENIIS